MYFKKTRLVAVAAAFLFASQSNAALVEVDSGFGELPDDVVSAIGLIEGDIFGGDGIPFDTLNWQTLDMNGDDSADLVMAMSATQRFQSPEVTNNGVDTYYAGPGISAPDRSLWNFNFLLGAIDGSDISSLFTQNNGPLSLNIFYELDPNSGENAMFDASLLPVDPDFSSILQFSWNLGFSFLSNVSPGFNSGAALDNGETFNPFANGVYDFTALLTDADSSASIDIDVVVEANTPATIALFAFGLAGLISLRKRI
uniref:hypothetical protein n=1 Tax=Ningiella ruwaisensis TaxID=2364274 RepID=UPI0010A0068A|nr:hypothetical protein [Ningiella ruwaisensis]